MNSKPDRYRVVGNPIAQSKSPEIHALFAKQTSEPIVYDKALIELGNFANSASAFFESGAKGMNVTAPFKEDAYEFADSLSKRAELAGAVNTLAKLDDGSIQGDNTDGQGLIWDITERLGWQIKDKNVLILGAGGATKGVLYMLLAQQPAKLAIANRTLSKAGMVADKFADIAKIDTLGFDHLAAGYDFDIIINATSASLSGELPDIDPSIFSGRHVYDMVYGKTITPFLSWAERHAALAISDGFGMLVGQAAESFYIWRKKRPDIQASFEYLKARL